MVAFFHFIVSSSLLFGWWWHDDDAIINDFLNYLLKNDFEFLFSNNALWIDKKIGKKIWEFSDFLIRLNNLIVLVLSREWFGFNGLIQNLWLPDWNKYSFDKDIHIFNW